MSSMTATKTRRLPSTPLIGLSLAYFMVLLDTTVLAVAEPSIMSSLHTDVVGVGWTTTAYTMALASALVFGGGLADRYGAYRVFVNGVAGFGAASLGCALAPGLWQLLLFRGLLGLFAAVIIPSSLGLIAALYRAPADRGRAISAWAAISGAAMAAGPVVGGWLIAITNWRAAFVINSPIVIVVLILCRTKIQTASQHRHISWLQHIRVAATLASVTLAITQAGQRSWLASATWGLIGAVLTYTTIATDRVSQAPLIPSALRQNKAVWTAFAWGAVINFALTTVLFSLPLLLHTDARQAGLTLLPMTVLIAVNPLLTGRMVAKHGPLRPIRMGFLALPLGLCLVGLAVAHHDQSFILSVGLILSGLGVSWTLPALVGFAVTQATPDTTGSVGGLLNAVRQVGATVAAAFASATLGQGNTSTSAVLPFLVAALLCLVGLYTAARRES